VADILVLHLSSGEDIIGKARLDDQGINWLVEDAVRPNIMMDPESGRARVALVPVIPYGDSDNLLISTLHVLFTVPAAEQMQNAYRQMTSGIVTPEVLPPSSPSPTNLKSILQG
jgi:hypothetical protein